MLLLTLRGIPTWYYGDELGLQNASFPAARLLLVHPQTGTSPERDRLVARTPMQWAPGLHAGFSEAEPWLPLASEDPELTVERQREEPGSVLLFVRALIQLRGRTPALSIGSYRSLPAPDDVFSFDRWHPDGAIQVHLNFGDRTREVVLVRPARILLSTSGAMAPDAQVSRLALRPYEGLIVG
jgi:alpha-glucosidase